MLLQGSQMLLDAELEHWMEVEAGAFRLCSASNAKIAVASRSDEQH